MKFIRCYFDMGNNYYFLINSLEWWGAERVTINFANNFVKEGKEVYIITLKSINFYDLPKWVHYISLSNIKSNLLMFLLIPLYVLRLRKVLKKHNLIDWMSLLEIANFVHILAKKHAVISFRTHIHFFTGILGYIQKMLIKRLYPKADKIIVNSMENKYDLTEYLHISEHKIEVMYNPIDKEKIDILKNEKIDDVVLQKIKNKKVFITTWRLIWQKHHKRIINALKVVYDTVDKNWIYLIIGDWPEKSTLKKLVKDVWLQENVVFLWMQKNVFIYLNIADVFLYASEVEGFPNVLLEAKEMWLPILTSDFKSGAKEVILWEYTKNIWKNLKYPYQGKYWILIDSQDYINQFLTVYQNILYYIK